MLKLKKTELFHWRLIIWEVWVPIYHFHFSNYLTTIVQLLYTGIQTQKDISFQLPTKLLHIIQSMIKLSVE